MTGGSEVLYTYNRDELISFDGRTCGNYDGLGNPHVYRGKTATWTHLRNLASLGDTQFTYGADGLRRTKTIGDNEAKYIWAEGKLLAEQRTVCTSDMELPCYPYENQPNYTYATEYTIQYLYGIDGLAGFVLTKEGNNTRAYYYRKNLQGDITHIFDENNNLKARYVYDAWGNCKIVYNEDNIANVNPFRYRGYYWDNSVKLYYLKSRYYDPETGRFINMDSIKYLDLSRSNGLNLYLYARNNPLMYTDSTGRYPVPSFNAINLINNSELKNGITFELEGSWQLFKGLIGYAFANISYTASIRDEEPKMFYSFSSVGIDSIKNGVGFNLGGWYGQNIYYTTDGSIGSQQQLTPWVHYGFSVGLKGIGINFGLDIGNTSHDINISIGWGTIAIVGVVALAVYVAPVAAAVLAPIALVVTFLDWLF